MDKLHQFIVRGEATHQPAQIMVPDRKKTSTDLAIGGDPDSAAVATEWLRDRRDDSDFANAILEFVTSSRFTALVWNLDKAAVRCHALQDLVQRDHDVARPDATFFERHKLDEAHHHAFFTRELAETYDLIVI